MSLRECWFRGGFSFCLRLYLAVAEFRLLTGRNISACVKKAPFNQAMEPSHAFRGALYCERDRWLMWNLIVLKHSSEVIYCRSDEHSWPDGSSVESNRSLLSDCLVALSGEAALFCHHPRDGQDGELWFGQIFRQRSKIVHARYGPILAASPRCRMLLS